MIAYVVRRAGIGVVMLFTMALVTFVLFFAPGNPAINQCGKFCTAEKIQQISETYGYDQPVVVQFEKFAEGLFVGRDYPVNDAYRAQLVANGHEDQVIHCAAPCLGYSQHDARTVNADIAKYAPVTVSLAVAAFVLWIVIGILVGVLAAVFKGKWLDRAIVGVTLVVYALPTFFVGTFLLQYVAIKWKAFPYPRYVDPLATGDVRGWLVGLVLPAVTLALFYMAAYVRITRAFVLESMSEDYIRTARAKGLPTRSVLFKHGFRAALTPLVSMAGLDFAGLLAGAIITETVFAYQGLGQLTVTANKNNDLPVLVGLVLLAGGAVIVMNIVVDVLYAYIDPRVRLRK
ncbi:ABC transporter permease [Xylanimonas protaetiae]|uniref:ABC transporter permease n=1 Tax=Xylanimonas protaetiae TaxID=2509457 RepID=A0A4V0YG95_9MICO|nr:ABC transporter permease [Xylanimonas protaetiae]QAY70431.1 ABC transporter permease [Xylanimonas protaetiae]